MFTVIISPHLHPKALRVRQSRLSYLYFIDEKTTYRLFIYEMAEVAARVSNKAFSQRTSTSDLLPRGKAMRQHHLLVWKTGQRSLVWLGLCGQGQWGLDSRLVAEQRFEPGPPPPSATQSCWAHRAPLCLSGYGSSCSRCWYSQSDRDINDDKRPREETVGTCFVISCAKSRRAKCSPAQLCPSLFWPWQLRCTLNQKEQNSSV